MEKKLFVSPSPHVHGGDSTTRLMQDVVIALLPALAVSVWVFGLQTLVISAVAVASCVLFEYLIQRWLLKGASTIGNFSAVVTGLLLAFNLPVNIPVWLVILGSLVAIAVGKMTFGGLGKNPFNPALVGRVFLLISFPVQMTSFTAVRPDAMSGATPLAFVKEALKNGEKMENILAQINYTDLLTGFKAGSLGEVAALALLAGFVYLLVRKVISWHIPVAVLGSMAVLSAVLWGIDSQHYMSPLFHLLTGGALLGAIFMATDYVTSPMTHRGMLIYGCGIGVLTILIRTWGAYPEGMSFAILIMNSVVPLLNKYVKPRRFGVKK